MSAWFLVLPVVAIVYLLYEFPIIIIYGNSMYPNLHNGEVYLGKRLSKKENIKIGHVYVFIPPYIDEVGAEEKYVIKRLHSVDIYNPNRLFFVGDNLDGSYDSRSYGFVDRKSVKIKLFKKVGFIHGEEED